MFIDLMIEQLEILPARRHRNGVHPSISADQISVLVDRFYSQVFDNALLGPIFEQQTTDNWPLHLEKMKAFWRSVLLKTGEYKGKPVPAHQKLNGITTQHFDEWLTLFSQASDEAFSPDAAPLVNAAAARIATSLWLSRTTDPFASPPEWSAARTHSSSDKE